MLDQKDVGLFMLTKEYEKVNNEEIKTAGERLPFPTKEFNSDEADTAFTRTTWNLISTGQLNYGPIEDQLSKSKEKGWLSPLRCLV